MNREQLLFNIPSDYTTRENAEQLDTYPSYREFVSKAGAMLIEDYKACETRFIRLLTAIEPQLCSDTEADRQIVIDVGAAESPGTGKGRVQVTVRQINFGITEPKTSQRSGFLTSFDLISDYNPEWTSRLGSEQFNDRYQMLQQPPATWSHDHFKVASEYHSPRICLAEDTLNMLEGLLQLPLLEIASQSGRQGSSR